MPRDDTQVNAEVKAKIKFVDGWWFPVGEEHLPEWMRNPKVRMVINGRPAYQGKKQLALLAQAAHVKGQLRRVVDVGAHVGLWSFNLAPACMFLEAFEPVALHRECFVLNVDMIERITLHACALGAAEGLVSIQTGPASSGDSWVAGPGDIPMRTLDSFEFPDVDVIKIDCEGYEEHVLRGAMQTLQRCRPVICVEQKRTMAADRFGLETMGAVKLLEGIGYRVVNELNGDFILTP